MKARKLSLSLAAAVGTFALLVLSSPGMAQPVGVALSSTEVAAAVRSAHLAEPLFATAPTGSEEDGALVKALADYQKRAKADDVSSLTAFLARYPHSGWAPALLTNLGLSYLHYGYFSRALDAWRMAWRLGRDAQETEARAIVDRAVGELARLESELGHVDELTALFEEIGSRPVSGSATEAVQAARETLGLVEKDPRHLFICGPLALRMLMLSGGAEFQRVDFLQWYRAGLKGTNLAEIGGLADKAKFAHRIVFRESGQKVPWPSIVHWKVGHFAAIVGEANGRFHIQDSVFASLDRWMTPDALDAEASGYFLVGADAPLEPSWRAVNETEAATVWGRGPTNQTLAGDAGDVTANDNEKNCPLCNYDIKESAVGVMLFDVPVGYTPPIGPLVKVRITYNQREDSQPAVFSFSNISQKWTFNWLSYVTDDPTNPGANVSRYLAGGGAFYYSGFSTGTGRFAAQFDDGSVLVLSSQTPVIYRRLLKDGSVEVYSQSDGSTAFPRNIFLTQVIDPQGNAVTLNYDGTGRLTSLSDAIGRQTTFTYGLLARPLLVTQITDPFGRSANLSYDGNGRLTSITDILGLTSSFAYDSNSLVNAMTTPYGTMSFAYTAPGTSSPPRFVQVTDAMGFNEREEWLEPASIPDSDSAATVPQGMPLTPTNQYLSYRDSFHWDKNAYVVAGCTPTGGCDYTKARDRHFTHVPSGTTIKSTAIESVKNPLENRIWYQYAGQSSSINAGIYNQPIAAGRVLDDGSTQLYQYAYDTAGFFNLTQTIDPLGRTTNFSYSNQIDLAAVSQITELGIETTVAQFNYNSQHRPIVYTDAAGQTTNYTYNAAGQMTSIVNALGQITTFQYDPFSNPVAIINANSLMAASFTYDGFDRMATYTDSEGWVARFSYDNADRVTKITYPDTTSDIYVYDRLDLTSYTDRQGRVWIYAYNANRRLTSIIDPLGQQITLAYDHNDQLTGVVDAKSNATSWSYDVQGRLTSKQYADTSTVTYTYETTTSRLKSVLDALGQTKQLSYAKDDRLLGISYLAALNPTPNVTFAYDPFFPRVISMTDGNGTTQYSYVPVAALGALQVQQENGPLANSSISYVYDQLGRISIRAVGGSGPEKFQYDAIGRRIRHSNDLGAFALSYLGQTKQQTRRQLLPAASNLATNWSYLDNTGDRRLASVSNIGLTTSQFSTFQFTTTPENFTSAVTETSDTASVYPLALAQTASYNNLNQLTNLSGQALSYDLNGNLTSDGQRSYTWDAENRLVGITYPGQPGKQTAFAYDGLGRRTAITSTPSGGGPVTTGYVWCGVRLCQARNGSNALTRAYFDEGEFVAGTTAQSLFYGPDKLGSVRRVFASTTSAPAYNYDPYGNALQTTSRLTDFGYEQMFYNSESGLYLTPYRAYDPVTGRWLSRDPLGEFSDASLNLYRYSSNDPIDLSDPLGLSSCLGSCIYNYYVSEAMAIGGLVLGAPILSKPFPPSGTGGSAGTSIASRGLSRFITARLPFRVWAPTFAVPLAATSQVGRLLGRWVPVAGWVIFAYDAYEITVCTYDCTNNPCPR